MTEKEREQSKELQTVSPLAKDMTYGERVHDFIFNNLINFWVNLIVSAAFTYWVNHSVRTFGKQNKRPAEFQKDLAGFMERKLPIMKLFKNDETKQEVAANMAGVLTLTAAGHAVMIPSVWIGAKIKAPFVKMLNRMHYGEDAMEDPSLKARHARIEAEERPTLLGAFVGRAGTIVATHATAYTLGSHVNLLRWTGEKLQKTPLKFLSNFKGIDDFTSQAGDKFGGALTDMVPERMGKLNDKISKKYTWSLRQTEDPHRPVPSNLPYGHTLPDPASKHGRIGGGFSEHYGKYVVSDIMYSAVTAITIAPAINFLKQFIPGLTYKPKVSAETRALAEQAEGQVRVRPNPIMDQVIEQEKTINGKTPHIEVSEIKNVGRIADAQQELQHG